MGNKWKLSTSSKPKPSNINKINQGSQIKFSYQDLIYSTSLLFFFFFFFFFFEEYEIAEFAATEFFFFIFHFFFIEQYEIED